jgi:undecaprenyl diphosphate synthase
VRPAEALEVPTGGVARAAAVGRAGAATAQAAAARRPDRRPIHVGVIMDGNGRWAQARGLPRRFGHRAGAKAVRRTVEAAPGLGIGTLTLYAFSCDNWRRPAPEVEALMTLLEDYLVRERERAVREGVRLSVIGRRDRLRPTLLAVIADAERATAGGRRLHLRLAVDYSGRDAILAAASRGCWEGAPDRRAFERSLHEAMHSPTGVPELDLVIRTGGEKRLSDFLLWESAYAELYFTDRLWPDFSTADLEQAVREFAGRERRFGGIEPESVEPLDVEPGAGESDRDHPNRSGERLPAYLCDSAAAIPSSTRWRNLNET